MAIREATVSDIDSLVQLNLDVHQMHYNERPDEFKNCSEKDIEKNLKDVLSDNSKRIFISEDGDIISGYVLINIQPRKENPFQKGKRFIYIDHIDIKKEYRSSGIGKALINKAKEFAKDQEISQVILDVWNFNQNAILFFKSQDFLPMIERMELNL